MSGKKRNDSETTAVHDGRLYLDHVEPIVDRAIACEAVRQLFGDRAHVVGPSALGEWEIEVPADLAEEYRVGDHMWCENDFYTCLGVMEPGNES